MLLTRSLLIAMLAALVSSCGGGGGSTSSPVFVFRLHGFPATQEFRARTESAKVIDQAREQLKLPIAERKLFVAGPIKAGNGGVNLAWSWHLADFALSEAAIELCDGTPALVEQDLDYWLGTVKRFCPWSAYVHAELE